MRNEKKFQRIYNIACSLMEMGLEPTSAFKEAAFKEGLEYGTEEMQDFVIWANVTLSEETN